MRLPDVPVHRESMAVPAYWPVAVVPMVGASSADDGRPAAAFGRRSRTPRPSC